MSDLARIEQQVTGVQLAEEFKKRLTDFVTTLNALPGKNEVKDHPFLKSNLKDASGKTLPVKYVPIEQVEAKLNHYFMGMWQTFNFKYTVIVNEIVGDLELAVWHPEAGVWLRRSGTGAVIIQQRAEYEQIEGKRVKKENDYLDINRKIANTLTKDMGHLKAECIKNAARSLGQSFGSNLNREIEDEGFNPEAFVTVEEVLEQITVIKSKDDLIQYFDMLPTTIKNDKRVKNLFTERRLQIQKDQNDSNLKGN
jgi:hypothetical protein